MWERRENGHCPIFCVKNESVLCGESEENLKVMVERFVEVCKRMSLKVNTDKNKVMVLGGEEFLYVVYD